MSTIYEYKEVEGVWVDTLTDEETGIRLWLNRHGAEPVSFARRGTDGNWIGFLWRDGELQAPAEGWKNHSTVMGYFIHRLKGEQSIYLGHPIKGATHSFLRHKDFAAPAVDTSDNTLTYTIGPAEIMPEEYPFKVQLDLTYQLRVSGDQPELQVTFSFTNLEAEQAAEVSFGLHPGFAVKSLAEARVILPKGTYIRHLAPDNFLSGELVRIEHAGGPMPFDKKDLPGSFLLELKDVPERVFTVEDPGGHRRSLLNYQEAPYLTIWSDGHDFVCVEPCWGLPDHQEQRPFEDKEGLQEIAPGEILSRSFSIRPELIP